MKDSVKKWILLGGLAAVVVVFLVVKSLSGVEDFMTNMRAMICLRTWRAQSGREPIPDILVCTKMPRILTRMWRSLWRIICQGRTWRSTTVLRE